MSVTCLLKVGGQAIADQPEDLRRTTTALDGLSVTWGRESNLDQPKAATCTATVSIPASQARAVLDAMTIGRRMTVTATTTLTTTGTAASLVTDLQNARSDWPLGGTRQSLVIDSPADPGTGVTVRVAPGPVHRQGEERTAWDLLPRVMPGDPWSMSVALTLPGGTTATLHPVYYTGPWDETATLGPAVATLTTSGTLAATITPPTTYTGRWIGIGVRLYPLGAPWQHTATTWDATTGTWADRGRATLTTPRLTPPATSSTIDSTVFSGAITDLSATWDQATGTVTAALAAADFSAAMANMRVGDDPWPEQDAATRATRVASLMPVRPRVEIDPSLARMRLAARDVDSVAASQLLDEIAVSTGGVLWSATHVTTGEYLRIEDPTTRPALLTLAVGPDGRATTRVDPTRGLVLSARHLLLDSAALTRGTGDSASIASVRWKEAGTDDKGAPTTTERTETVTNTEAMETIGYRAVSITTSLASRADASALAARTLAMTAPAGWVMPTLTWDTDTAQDGTPANWQTVIELLDATRRIARPLVITDLPVWMPAAPTLAGYLDGGTYTYQGGAWTLTMRVTRPTSTSGAITWQRTPPALTWDSTTPLTWADLGTVTA